VMGFWHSVSVEKTLVCPLYRLSSQDGVTTTTSPKLNGLAFPLDS
jgi:hypothetical protein